MAADGQKRFARALAQRMFVMQEVPLAEVAPPHLPCGRPANEYACYASWKQNQQKALDRDALFRFDVSGSTGVLYHVRLRRRPFPPQGQAWSCTCPDHTRRRRPCKHIYLVQHRVLRLPREECLRTEPYRRSAPATLLELCCARSRQQRGSTNRHVQDLLEGKLAAQGDEANAHPAKLQDEQGNPLDCCICYEPLQDPWVACGHACATAIHQRCFESLVQYQRCRAPRCVLCRRPMHAARQKLEREKTSYITVVPEHQQEQCNILAMFQEMAAEAQPRPPGNSSTTS